MTGDKKVPKADSNDARQPAGGDPSGTELSARFRDLDARLDRKVEERARNTRGRPDRTGFAQALRLSTEFVSAVLVGAGLGWAVDRLLGIAPWGMIALLLLGFCAGVLNVLRAAGTMSDPHAQRPRLRDGERDRKNDEGGTK